MHAVRSFEPFRAALQQYLAMIYIVAVQASIVCYIGVSDPSSAATAISVPATQAVTTATIIVACVMTIALGLLTRLPFGHAPAMGINTFFAVLIASGVPYPIAFGICFWSGVILFVISVTPLLRFFAKALPRSVGTGLIIGMGLMLAVVGLNNAGFGSENKRDLFLPILTTAGLLVMVALDYRKVNAAIMIGIIGVSGVAITMTALGFFSNTALPTRRELFSFHPDFSYLGMLDFISPFEPRYLPYIFAITFAMLFDGVPVNTVLVQRLAELDPSQRETLFHDRQPAKLPHLLGLSGIGSALGALLGTTPSVTYIESFAGLEGGGRTGKTAVITGLLFLPLIIAAPLATLIHPAASAATLLMIGYLMLKGNWRKVHEDHPEEMLAAIATIVGTVLHTSFAHGLMYGLIVYVLEGILCGAKSRLTFTTGILSIASAAYLIWEKTSHL